MIRILYKFCTKHYLFYEKRKSSYILLTLSNCSVILCLRLANRLLKSWLKLKSRLLIKTTCMITKAKAQQQKNLHKPKAEVSHHYELCMVNVECFFSCFCLFTILFSLILQQCTLQRTTVNLKIQQLQKRQYSKSSHMEQGILLKRFDLMS